MVHIINPQETSKKEFDLTPAELNEVVRKKFLDSQDKTICSQKSLDVIANGKLPDIFGEKINQEIFTRKIADSHKDDKTNIFLCGMYVSELLANLAKAIPDSWWAIDYALSEDPLVLKKGGDVCFIICGVFPERSKHRQVSGSFYQTMGPGLYSRFYAISKQEIGHLMSCYFEEMTNIVKSCIHGI